MARAQYITDAFKEFRQMQVEEMKADNQHEMNMANMGIERVLTNEKVKDMMIARDALGLQMENQKMENELKLEQVNEQRRYLTPQSLSLYTIAGRGWMNNKKGIEDMKEVFRDLGPVEFSQADGIMKLNGKPLELTGPEWERNRIPMIRYISKRYTDTPALAFERLDRLRAERKKLEQDYKMHGSPGRLSPKRAQLAVQLKENEEQIKKGEFATSLPNLYKYYETNAQDTELGALGFASRGFKKAAAYLEETGKQYRQQADEVAKMMYGKDHKVDEGKIVSIWDNRRGTPGYGDLILTTRIYNTTDIDSLTRDPETGAPGAFVIDERPPGTEDSGTAGQHVDYTIAQAKSDIQQIYTMGAKNSGMNVSPQTLVDVRNTHEAIYDAAAELVGTYAPTDKIRYLRALRATNKTIKEGENQYWNKIDWIDSLPLEALLVKGGIPSMKNGAIEVDENNSPKVPANQKIDNAIAQQVSIPFTKKEAKLWWQEYMTLKWKKDFAWEIYSELGPYDTSTKEGLDKAIDAFNGGDRVLAESQIYTPSAFTKYMAEMEQDLGVSLRNKD